MYSKTKYKMEQWEMTGKGAEVTKQLMNIFDVGVRSTSVFAEALDGYVYQDMDHLQWALGQIAREADSSIEKIEADVVEDDFDFITLSVTFEGLGTVAIDVYPAISKEDLKKDAAFIRYE